MSRLPSQAEIREELGLIEQRRVELLNHLIMWSAELLDLYRRQQGGLVQVLQQQAECKQTESGPEPRTHEAQG